MMRSLWTAATGMIAQQTNVDTISHNIANVNTVGYKTEKVEFKSLLYQTLQTPTTTANGVRKPINAQVGLGTRPASITSYFTEGNFIDSENPVSFAVDGDGVVAIRGEDGGTYYTRNGDFVIAVGENNLVLTDSYGNPVLDTKGNPITFDKDVVSSTIKAGSNGNFYLNVNGEIQDLGMTIGLWQFNNPSGLEKIGDSLFAESLASGEAMNESTTNGLKISKIRQGYLEQSNVQVATEMVNMIVAQRAYELNSKAIQTSDAMLQTANELKR